MSRAKVVGIALLTHVGIAATARGAESPDRRAIPVDSA